MCAAIAPAHESLEHYLQFAMASVFHEGMLDTRLDIAFNGETALAERAKIDTNDDGLIAPEESAEYLRPFQFGIPNLLRLRLDQVALSIVPLFEPEVNFQEDRTVSEHPLTLSLSFFARLPAGGQTPRQLLMENALFPETAALLKWDVRLDNQGSVALLGQVEAAYPVTNGPAGFRKLAAPLSAVPMPAAGERTDTLPPEDATGKSRLRELEEREKKLEEKQDRERRFLLKLPKKPRASNAPTERKGEP
ncbi:MAG: hypothetical protein HYV26_14105 [Candidatus Hydrogenedentes bacterium]|nr:hypothetical protein [Candidatus Hydrogenedentota bacterium]